MACLGLVVVVPGLVRCVHTVFVTYATCVYVMWMLVLERMDLHVYMILIFELMEQTKMHVTCGEVWNEL